ncbi:MAG: 1-acyl-sn-glycerol-3-phosphate acyltransferase, partial [Aeriscardovia sp.]|nr:1-acyl-sn-glycerol-3-phosphate acyltransferase [Aeriscardovia sp.]
PHRFPVVVTYGRPIEVPKLEPEEITYERLRGLTDEIMRKIMVLSGQQYVDMYAQERKKQLKEEELLKKEEAREIPE